jgi:hypothetical protein
MNKQLLSLVTATLLCGLSTVSYAGPLTFGASKRTAPSGAPSKSSLEDFDNKLVKGVELIGEQSANDKTDIGSEFRKYFAPLVGQLNIIANNLSDKAWTKDNSWTAKGGAWDTIHTKLNALLVQAKTSKTILDLAANINSFLADEQITASITTLLHTLGEYRGSTEINSLYGDGIEKVMNFINSLKYITAQEPYDLPTSVFAFIHSALDTAKSALKKAGETIGKEALKQAKEIGAQALKPAQEQLTKALSESIKKGTEGLVKKAQEGIESGIGYVTEKIEGPKKVSLAEQIAEFDKQLIQAEKDVTAFTTKLENAKTERLQKIYSDKLDKLELLVKVLTLKKDIAQETDADIIAAYQEDLAALEKPTKKEEPKTVEVKK